jgi:uncharacterized protein (TIGR03435 family)
MRVFYCTRTIVVSLLGSSLLCSPLLAGRAQEAVSAGKLPVFSVISVKQNKLEDGTSSFVFKRDGLSIRHYKPMWLIVAGYELIDEDRVVNWPPWMMNEYCDIEAKVDEADVPALAKMTQEQQLVLLQQVFESRFNLKYHYESREFKVFQLVVAKGGPRHLTPSVYTDSDMKYPGRFHVEYQDVTMADLCLRTLSREAHLLVVDKTGLTGRYDFTLHWSRPDDVVNGAPSEEPLIFTAVQEQLGLKMIPGAAPFKVMIIDHIERPSEN